MLTLLTGTAFELCSAEVSESAISSNTEGRARMVCFRGLWGHALVTASLHLQFVLLDKHESPGTATVLELICNDDIFGQGGHNAF